MIFRDDYFPNYMYQVTLMMINKILQQERMVWELLLQIYGLSTFFWRYAILISYTL